MIDIGEGKLNNENDEIQLDKEYICENDLETEIFKENITNERYDLISNSAILATTNLKVNEINANIIDMFPGDYKIYSAIDYAKAHDGSEPDANLCTLEYLATINVPDIPLNELELKLNTTVMLLRNLKIKEGLCNGTRLRIMNMKENVIQCKILTGDKAGNIVLIPRITISSNKSRKQPFILYRHQFPIKLCFAMTINKSQGQTFENIGIDLTLQCFNHGQLYVAMSRVKRKNAIKIKLTEDNIDRIAKNPVYKEIFDY